MLCGFFDGLLSFSIMYSRYIYAVARIGTSFLFTAKIYSTVWISRRFFIHSFINGQTRTLNLLLFVAFEKESCAPLPWFYSNCNTARLTNLSALNPRCLDGSKLKIWGSRKSKGFGSRAGPHLCPASATCKPLSV